MPLLEKIMSVVAPHDCLICGHESKLVCDWCAHDAFPVLPSRCFRCKQITSDFAVCDKDKKHTRLRNVWVRTGYDGTAKQILQVYKFERARSAASVIAQAMDEALPYLDSKTLVVPVPTATSRVRERGYDQALLLAREIARSRRLAWSRAVTRVSQTRQVGSSRQKRIAQLKNSFLVVQPDMVKGQDVLLVDDVVTTGATLEAVTLALRQAGAKSVRALVFAQKQ